MKSIFPIATPFIQANYEKYLENIQLIKSKYLSFPRAISIETQVRCNAKCGFCPYPSSPRQGDEMDTEIFYKLLDDFSEIPESHIFSIALHRINEPLLDSRMKLFHQEFSLRYPQARHQFFSNGTTLKMNALEWIAEYEKSTLSVSVNSMDEERHQELMGFGLKSVANNLDHLHELVLAGAFLPAVTLHAPHLDDLHSKQFTEKCRARWPQFKVGIRPFFQWMGGTPAGGDHRSVAGLPNNPEIQAIDHLPCGQWFDLHILANGYVTKCCIDETGFMGMEEFDIRKNNALDVYRRRNDFLHTLPARGKVSDCNGCFHLG